MTGSSIPVELGRMTFAGTNNEPSEVSHLDNIWSGTSPSRPQEANAAGNDSTTPTNADCDRSECEHARNDTNNTSQQSHDLCDHATSGTRGFTSHDTVDATSSGTSLFGNAQWLPSFVNEFESFSGLDDLPGKLDSEMATWIVRLLSKHEHDLTLAIDEAEGYWMRWQNELKRVERHELATVDAQSKLNNAIVEHDTSHDLCTDERTPEFDVQVHAFIQSHLAKRHISEARKQIAEAEMQLEGAKVAAHDARAAIDVHSPVLRSLLPEWRTSFMDNCFARYLTFQQTRRRGLEMLERMSRATM